MILNSDILLHHQLWVRADEELRVSMGIFGRLVDIYLLACAIGIRADKVIIADTTSEPKSIGRSTYMSAINNDLSESLNYMLQNAILNTSSIHISLDERLKLAFDPDFNIPKIRAAEFLTGFANYGLEEIFKRVDSTSPLVVLDDLYKYFNELTEANYEDILKNITLDLGD